jgi:hypothetical protein
LALNKKSAGYNRAFFICIAAYFVVAAGAAVVFFVFFVFLCFFTFAALAFVSFAPVVAGSAAKTETENNNTRITARIFFI